MYSTVTEVHVALDLALRQLNSNRKLTLEPEEKDLLLNKGLLMYINTRFNPKTNTKREGYEDTVKRLDDLKDIKMLDKPITCYIRDDRSVYLILPPDYYHYVESEVKLYYNCNGVTNKDISQLSTSKAVLLFPKDTATSDFYKNFTITVDGTTIFNIANFSKFPKLNSEDARFMILGIVKNQLAKNGNYEVYWEKYNSTHYDNCFIIIDKNKTAVTATVTFGSITNTATFTTTVLEAYTNTANLTKPTDLVTSELIKKFINTSYFNKNRHNRPLCEVTKDNIVYYNDNKFVITTANLTYIKFPTFINYVTGSMPEFQNLHEIVDFTARNAESILAGSQYQIKSVESNIIE